MARRAGVARSIGRGRTGRGALPLEEERVTDDINARAGRIFGHTRGLIQWPYGLSTPRRFDFRNDATPERYESLLRRSQEAQAVIVDWAERYGLKMSHSGCCPKWLQGNVSRRCSWGAGRGSGCGYYGSSPDTLDRSWLDHTTFWLKDRQPVALASAPYGVSESDEARIRWWVEEDPRLGVAFGTGWYGYDTRQIVMWRTDRIADLAPAE